VDAGGISGGVDMPGVIARTNALLRISRALSAGPPNVKGRGLCLWQQEKLFAYINDHLGESISIATLAGLVRLSRSHFSRAFKRSIGSSPHRYHNTLRIERAKKLLEHSMSSLTEIGLIVGYCDASAFSRIFQQYTGQTPTAYRRCVRPSPCSEGPRLDILPRSYAECPSESIRQMTLIDVTDGDGRHCDGRATIE
jgi:AraC-like DNA-binding protein